MAAVYDPSVARSDQSGRAVDLLEQLVSIPSVTGSEESVIDFVEDFFRERGWSSRSISVSPGRRNLLIHRKAPKVVLTTHADTVPEQFLVLIECENEAEQTELLERFVEEGLNCKALLG